MDSAQFLNTITDVVVARIVSLPNPWARLATVDPAYTSGAPKLTFEGETELSGKGYKCLSGYTPVAADRVLVIGLRGNWIVVDSLT